MSTVTPYGDFRIRKCVEPAKQMYQHQLTAMHCPEGTTLETAPKSLQALAKERNISNFPRLETYVGMYMKGHRECAESLLTKEEFDLYLDTIVGEDWMQGVVFMKEPT